MKFCKSARVPTLSSTYTRWVITRGIWVKRDYASTTNGATGAIWTGYVNPVTNLGPAT